MTSRKLMFRAGSIVLNCGAGTAQFGLDRRWALRLSHLRPGEIEWLQAAASHAKPPASIAPRHQIAAHRVSEILATLSQAGVLLPNPVAPKAKPYLVSQIVAANPAAELPALSALRPDGDGHQTLIRRAQSTVAITSANRLGAGLALLLAAAGVGRLLILDASPVLPEDLVPYRAAHLGTARCQAVKLLVAEVAPLAEVITEGTPDVVISVEFGTQTSAYFGPLLSLATPHLPIATQEASAEIGPFVLPNNSACTHCLQLTRRNADEDWAGLITEVAETGAVGLETSVGVAAAGLAGAQVLSFLDGGRPALLNRVATISAPDVIPALTEVAPHPDCGCVSLK